MMVSDDRAKFRGFHNCVSPLKSENASAVKHWLLYEKSGFLAIPSIRSSQQDISSVYSLDQYSNTRTKIKVLVPQT